VRSVREDEWKDRCATRATQQRAGHSQSPARIGNVIDEKNGALFDLSRIDAEDAVEVTHLLHRVLHRFLWRVVAYFLDRRAKWETKAIGEPPRKLGHKDPGAASTERK
jgi:hypothetical protein